MVYSAESMAQVELGRQGEHLARTVQIDVSCLQRAFPEAAFALVYRLPRETALYIAETELIGPLLTWAVPAQATQKAGTGRLEVRAMVGETVAKSVTAKTRVEESLTGAGETPPESAGDWVGKVLDAAERAEAAADRAEQAGGAALPPRRRTRAACSPSTPTAQATHSWQSPRTRRRTRLCKTHFPNRTTKRRKKSMAYDVNKLVKLQGLKDLATQVKSELAALSTRIDDIVSTGGEPNVLTGVKVNGTTLSIVEKMVDILIATGTANGTLAVNGVDVAIKGLAALAYKAQGSQADLDAALQAVTAGIGGEEDDYATVVSAIEGKLAAALATITAGGTNGHLNVGGTDVTVYAHPAHTPQASGLYKITVDAEGHVSAAAAVEKADITGLGIPAQDTTYAPAVAGGANGLLTGADKQKLDGLQVASDAEVTEMLDEVFPAA